MRPEPDTTICDPACGTGGFLLAAHDYIVDNNRSMDQGQLAHLRDHGLHGWEIVDSAARLGVMNLYLHGIGGDETNIIVDDSLRTHPGINFDMVLTNPPFGRKSSLTFVGSDGAAERESLVVERPRLLGNDQQQADQLPSARTDTAEDSRKGRCRRTGQRTVRGRRRGDGAAPTAERLRRSHPVETADRDFLRPGGQGQRAVLRPQAGQ